MMLAVWRWSTCKWKQSSLSLSNSSGYSSLIRAIAAWTFPLSTASRTLILSSSVDKSLQGSMPDSARNLSAASLKPSVHFHNYLAQTQRNLYTRSACVSLL